MTITGRAGLALFATLGLAAAAPLASASERGGLGVRFGAYTDSNDAFVGGEGIVPVGRRLDFVPNLEFVFVSNGTFLTANFDLAYNLPDNVRNADFWAGGGLAILNSNPDGPRGSSTDVGVNLFMGAGLHTGSVKPYVQLKGILADSSSFVVGLGLRF